MNRAEIREALSRLTSTQRFTYGKDDYCFQLLRYAFPHGASIAEVKRSHYRALLTRPAIKGWLAGLGGGRLFTQGSAATGARKMDFQVSYSTWDGVFDWRWAQVSRRGLQLVLQLNFPEEHEERYNAVFGKEARCPFRFSDHPVRTKGLNTLAWARIDLDPFTGEALIEEVQNDWLREAGQLEVDCRTYKSRRGWRRRLKRYWKTKASLEDVLTYTRETVSLYGPLWHEALMAATYQVLVEVLGYQTIYMHSWETGCELKRCSPPRSLYSQLPRRFCMQAVNGGPRLVTAEPTARRALRRIKAPVWYRSQIGRRYQNAEGVRHEAA